MAIRVTQVGKEVWRTTANSAPAEGHADGQASVSGFARVPATGHADGIADVTGYTHDVIKAAGNADGVANVNGAAGVPATGHANGQANVSSGATAPGRRGGGALIAGI